VKWLIITELGKLGRLTPGAEYVYETPDGGQTIYAREVGAPSNQRILIGDNRIQAKMQETQLWNDIREMAKINPGLNQMLEQVVLTYYLLKKQQDKND
jgi:hypothetical protein